MVTANILFKSTVIQAAFYVTKSGNNNLVSRNTAKSLEILKITVNTALNIRTITPENQFQHLFDRIGKIGDKIIKLHVNQSHRRIPFHIRKDVETELQRLEKLEIIEKVDGPHNNNLKNLIFITDKNYKYSKALKALNPSK